MARPQLSAEPRTELGKKVSHLRRDGRLPAVVYGVGRESQPVSLDMREFEQLRRRTGRNAVLDLTIAGDGKAQPVLLQTIQEHPVSRQPLHVDLLVVNMEEERTADLAIVYSGDSPAVSRLGGVLLHLRDAVSVRAKPDDLPSGIELDISPLDSFEAVLHVSDLTAPAGVTILTDSTEAIARVQPPRVEEEVVVAAEEGVEGEEVEAGEAEAAADAGAEGSAEESSES
jgi:large subunit ribosomal protein L25